MKTFAIISILLLAQISRAENSMNLLCMTEIPTTSFVVHEVDDLTVLEIFHHNGASYMPIFDGIATNNDLKTLAERGSILTDLGNNMRFEWPRGKCTMHDDLISECISSTAVQDLYGHKVKAWHFESTKITEKTASGTYESYKLTVNLDVDGQSLAIPMKYDVSECTDQMTMRSPISKVKR